MSNEDAGRALSNLRKRRAVVRVSITKLGNRLRDLEESPKEQGVSDRARQLAAKLDTLDADFKTLHFQIVDLIDERAPELDTEQDTLDKHDDDVTGLSVRVQQLITNCSIPDTVSGRKSASRKLLCLERNLKDVDEALNAIRDDHDDVPLLEQHGEHLADYQKQLTVVYKDLMSFDLEDEDHLLILHAHVEKLLFKC